MSLIVVENAAAQPITDEVLHEADQLLLPCLEARNATWYYSLLSVHRDRMVCTFKAPDAESVRDSYRRVGLERIIWTGEPIKPEGEPLQRPLTVLSVVEGTYPPLSDLDWNAISQKLLDYCAASGTEWLQSYRSLDRTKVVYELNAPDLKTVQAVQQLGIDCDRVWSAQVLSPALPANEALTLGTL